jgi:hypothetical protein
VLEGDLCVRHLSSSCHATELPAEFCALRQTYEIRKYSIPIHQLQNFVSTVTAVLLSRTHEIGNIHVYNALLILVCTYTCHCSSLHLSILIFHWITGFAYNNE